MKILFISSSFRGGGITTYAHETVNCLSREHEVSVVIGNDEKKPFDRKKYIVYNIESEDTSINNAQKLLEVIDKSRPSVIINSNALLMSLLSPYVDNSIRIINVSHSLRYNEADIAGCNSNFVDTIIALSTFNENYLRSKYNIKEKNKVKIVYNFVRNVENVQSIIEQKKTRERLRIVYAGGTSAAKSPELVYQILRGMLKTEWNFDFYFMGSDSPTLKSIQFYNSIKEVLPADPRVIITGRISREEALKLSTSANIFLIPSRREGCPMAMLEAMSGGAIIITSDYKNACQEMVENGKNGYVIPHSDVDAFVNQIGDIINNHNNYLSFYDESYLTFINRFSFIPWSRKMFKIVDSQEFMHKDRFVSFSIKRYKKDLSKINKRKIYNKYHMLLFETMKSAVPFFIYKIRYGN